MQSFKLIYAFVAALFLAGVSTSAFAEIKIGFVSLQRIGNEAPQAVRAMKKLKAEFAQREQDLQRLDKSLKAAQEKMEKEGTSMPDADRRAKEREFAEMNREFERKRREFREEFSIRQNEELLLLNESVSKVIRKIAETEKFDLIIQEAVFFSPTIDITPRVIKALGENGGTLPAATPK